jgi:hypothetical protein
MKNTKIKKFDELSKDIEDKELEININDIKSGKFEIELRKVEEMFASLPNVISSAPPGIMNRNSLFFIKNSAFFLVPTITPNK